MKNHRWAWSAYSTDQHRALFTLWEDEFLSDQTYCLWRASDTEDPRKGAREMKRNCDAAMADRKAVAYGIRQRARSLKQSPRIRAWFDDQSLLKLKLFRTPKGIFAKIGEEISSVDLIDSERRKSSNALNDLDHEPPGNQNPDRARTVTNSFVRNSKVRAFVLKKAEGKCEYCGKRGFTTVSGQSYLEAHHIISLAKQGPDSVQNVIALCPDHHRQAHYGMNAVELEGDFIKRIQLRNGR